MKLHALDLRCEYVKDPIGVHAKRPLLSWRGKRDIPGGAQSAYRIVASSGREKLLAGDYDCWDSGIIRSSQCVGIEYGGAPLQSAQRVWWRVQIFGAEQEESTMSEPAFFEMGLLSKKDWDGRWMSFLGGMIGNGLIFRRSFELPEEPVRARAYAAFAGYGELWLNGEKVGDKVLSPGATDMSKTILYSAYDVTDRLHKGLNAVGMILGTGWAGHPKVLLQMNIELPNGEIVRIVTDYGVGWMIAKGPILYNSIYDGEDYDARLEKDGWCTKEYEKQAQLEHQRPGGWILPTIAEDPGGERIGEIMEPIRIVESTEPKKIGDLPDGRELYDAGVNRAGWVKIRVRGARGSSVKLTFAEVLNEQGDLDLSYLRTARVQDSYTLRGDLPQEIWEPRFTYHGFRYFTVEKSGDPEILELTAQAVQSDVARNARFSCEDPYLNRLAWVMYNSEASNLHSIPTDCDQRDERHGWTNDTTARTEGTIYHAHVAAFFEKWVRDIYDTQDENGYIADTAPHRWGNRPCDPQVNSLITLPLQLYTMYGNRRVLETYYEGMKRYLEALRRESEDYLVSRTGFGEWACPRSECYEEPFGPGATSKNVSPTLVSSSYFHLSASQIRQIAEILGKAEDVPMLDTLCDSIRDRFNRRFFHPDTFSYDQDTESALALSLQNGLVPEEYRQKTAQRLAEIVREKDYHFTTGNMGTKALIEMLCENGFEDTVYELFVQRTAPSFGYMLKQGATTMWERWEADNNNNIMNSRNHPMLSSCCTWFYKYLGGIRPMPGTAGFQKLLIRPVVPTKLSRAQVSMEIPAGSVMTRWEKENGALRLHAELPFNAPAQIVLAKKYAKAGAKLLGTEQKGVIGIEETADEWRIEAESGIYDFALE